MHYHKSNPMRIIQQKNAPRAKTYMKQKKLKYNERVYKEQDTQKHKHNWNFAFGKVNGIY